MARSQPFYAPCRGGLKLGINKFDLLGAPGVAVRLRNYEASLKGGYRRINGYMPYGGDYATQPAGTGKVIGVHDYSIGVVAVAGSNVYYTDDGQDWIQVNKDTTDSGAEEGDLPGLSDLPRANPDRARFALARGEDDHADNPYGVLYIATGDDALAKFYIEGSGAARKFFYKEVSDGYAPIGADCLEIHDQHLCVVDKTNDPSVVHYSNTGNFSDFTGQGSGNIAVTGDTIIGIKSFRDMLYVFCKNSIHRLVNINDPNSLQILPVTNNLGCLSEFSIQEIGGDVVFLSPDGIRPVSATERIDDVELGTISRDVQPLINDIISGVNAYTISSVVIREKNQYRLYYSSPEEGRGILGTLVSAEEGWVWSELRGIQVNCISSSLNINSQEVIYHSDDTNFIYLHDKGSTFDGTPIESIFDTPDFHCGDLGLRKTLHYLNIAVNNEGRTDLMIGTYFDFRSERIMQPPPKYVSMNFDGSIYGDSEAIYGSAIYSSSAEPLVRIPMQGSGSSISFRFYSNNTSDPFTIQGFHLEVFPSGRK